MINFPDSPTTNQVFSTADVSWIWDTVKWKPTGESTWIVPLFDISESGTVPDGFSGVVDVRNGTGAPVSVTLPAGPVMGQMVTVKDAVGNAGTYSITIVGTIDGNPSYKLMSDYMSIEMYWMGSQWGVR